MTRKHASKALDWLQGWILELKLDPNSGLKFIYSEKTTKFCEIFVAFSDYTNFEILWGWLKKGLRVH